MKTSPRFLASILCLLFIFPIAWQSLHQYSHVHDHSEAAVPSAIAFSGHEGQCPVCAYEFAKFEPSEQLFSLVSSAFFTRVIQSPVTPRPDSFAGFCISLRAPPETC
jgi:hypothetical protein